MDQELLQESESLQAIAANLRASFDFLPAWGLSLALFGAAALVAWVAHTLLHRTFRRITQSRGLFWRSLVARSQRPALLVLFIVAWTVADAVAPLSDDWSAIINHLLLVALIVLLGWLAMIAIHIFSVVYSRQFQVAEDVDSTTARKHVTQVRILKRVANIFIILLTFGAALLTFESVRHYGVSLLASAGAAGIVLGFALQPILKNLVAGIQIAITQPIRIGDTVIVEREWGTIEEITSTYVVVRVWDLRRLILPLTYFLETPFQNWTREQHDILGTVFLRVDYRTPFDALRSKFEEILKDSPLWDGKTRNVQITEAGEHSVEIRFLMSARDSYQAWDLRCAVRERLLVFMQENYPDCLPRQRAELAPLAPGNWQDSPISMPSEARANTSA